MAEWRKATLIKIISDDGLFQMWEDVSIGKEYEVDISSRRIESGYNTTHGVYWKKEIIDARDGGWFPTELLWIHEKSQNTWH